MDFRHQIAAPDALAGVAADALVVVIAGDEVDASLDGAVAALVKDAVSHGDSQFKAGRTLYLHRPQGLKAARLVVAAAGAGTVKAFRSAVANALSALKGGGARSVAVSMGQAGEVTGQHAEALTAAASECVYLYRQTKPSAP